MEELTREGRTIQHRLPKGRTPGADSNLARTFSNLMFKSKCQAALRLLSDSGKGDVLHLNDPVDPNDPLSPSVREALLHKHPPAQQAHPECLLDNDPEEPHPVIFESLDASAIRAAALKISGAAGPSGLDALEWRRLCTCHKVASRDLCASLAIVAQRICTSYVDPIAIKPLLVSRLVQATRSTPNQYWGHGSPYHRQGRPKIIVGPDIQDATGCRQLCGGQTSGTEAAVHAARTAFELETTEAILLVDATNAFNALNRQVALHNIRRLCPPIATILINSYRSPSDLLVDGDVILSQEGTTQGDPLAMPMYGLATIPIIRKLDSICEQIWFADDSAAIGKIAQLHAWWTKLIKVGPAFGYLPNPAKTWIVGKQDHLNLATDTFRGSGVNVTSEGRPYLGAAIGTSEYLEKYVSAKVSEWSSCVNNLSSIA